MTEMLKPLDLYVFLFLKWVHIDEILIKQSVSFLMKDEKLFNKNIMNFWKKISSDDSDREISSYSDEKKF